MPLWLNDGRLVLDAQGRLVVCDDCPCIEPGTGTVGNPCLTHCAAQHLPVRDTHDGVYNTLMPYTWKVSYANAVGGRNDFYLSHVRVLSFRDEWLNGGAGVVWNVAGSPFPHMPRAIFRRNFTGGFASDNYTLQVVGRDPGSGTDYNKSGTIHKSLADPSGFTMTVSGTGTFDPGTITFTPYTQADNEDYGVTHGTDFECYPTVLMMVLTNTYGSNATPSTLHGDYLVYDPETQLWLGAKTNAPMTFHASPTDGEINVYGVASCSAISPIVLTKDNICPILYTFQHDLTDPDTNTCLSVSGVTQRYMHVFQYMPDRNFS